MARTPMATPLMDRLFVSIQTSFLLIINIYNAAL
jgi:hypothetical protein